MKKAALIILLVLSICPICFSQSDISERRVTISTTEGSLGTILDELASKGNFSFSYGQDIPRDRWISVSTKRQTVQQYIEEIFQGEVYCIEYGTKLILMKRPDLPNAYNLRGRVIDRKTREAIPGVTVYLPETEPLVGSVSDEEGCFQLTVPADQLLVRLSCIGYESNSLIVGRDNPGTVELDPDQYEFTEVEIVYYQPAKEETLNSAMSTISTEKLNRNETGTIENSLQGHVAGVHVVRNSGMPGSSLQVKIRGINSLINSDPVYYLDGIYIQQTSLYALSPHDIDRIEVLKDASGTAAYGATAANGVVLLHSKKGSDIGSVVKFDYSIGQQQVRKTPDLLNKQEYVNYYEIVHPTSMKYDTLDIENIVETNWIEILFREALMQDYHFSFSGGGKRSTFYLSSGYYQQEAIIKELELNRFTFKLRSDHKLGKGIKLGHDFSLASLDFKGLKEGCFLNDHNNPILASMGMLPVSPDNDSIEGYWSNDANFPNPSNNVALSNNTRKNYSFFGNMYTSVQLLPGLKYTTRFGSEIYFQDNLSFSRPETEISEEVIVGNSYNILDLATDWYHSLAYSRLIAEVHLLTGSVDFEYGRNISEWIPLFQSGFDDSLQLLDDQNDYGNTSWENSRMKIEFSHYAWSGALAYAFEEKYQIKAHIRLENVSHYKLYHELHTLREIYPSISIGWLFNRENFFSWPVISYGKLRYGWGKAGNSPRINYSFFARTLRDFEYIYALNTMGEIAYSPSIRRFNQRFHWENMQGHNVGLDLGLFRNKLFFSFDYFNNRLYMGETYTLERPQEIYMQLNGMAGFGNEPLNKSSMVNKGFECEVSFKHKSHGLSWDLSLQVSHLKNQILDLTERELNIIERNTVYDPIAVNIPGEAAGSFYGYRIVRLFREEDCDPESGMVTNQPSFTNNAGNTQYLQPQAMAGDYQFADLNGDNKIDKQDKTILGNPFPDFTAGIYQSLSFRDFDFSFFIQGTWGNEIFNATKFWMYNPHGLSNWPSEILYSYRTDRYDSEGNLILEGYTDTDLHRVDFFNTNQNLRVSDFYIEDGSYLRVKNIQIGYTFSNTLTKRVFIQKFRIYIAAQNLLTWTNYSGLDPEVGGWGIDCGTYPQPRTYLAGLNLEF